MSNTDDSRKRFEEMFKNAAFFPAQDWPQTASEDEKQDFDFKFDLKPREVKSYLDRFIIGQNEAKKVLAIAVCDHYNHAQNEQEGSKLQNYMKQNVLLLGPTGVGKTYLIRCLADLIGVPFVKGDATKFSETGYVGQDVDDLVRQLIDQANGDIALAQYGIIYLDEVDKIASGGEGRGRDVSGRGVQSNLLKLMEETDVPVKSAHDIQAQMESAFDLMGSSKTKRQKTINTKNILFIVSGAFAQLPKIIRQRVKTGTVGFQMQNNAEDNLSGDDDELLASVTTQDLIEYGFEPEFIGRLPVKVCCHPLHEEDLKRILLTSEGSILIQYKQSFQAYGIELEFSEEAIDWVVKNALKEKTGARGLLSVLEKLLRDLKYEIPSTLIKKLEIDKVFIKDPQVALKKFLKIAQEKEKEYEIELIHEFEKRFFERNQLTIKFDEAAVKETIKLAEDREQPFLEFCEERFKDLAYALKLLASHGESKEFTITKDAVKDPQKTLGDWIIKAYKKK